MRQALVILVPAADLEMVSALLFELGAQGVEEQEPGMLLMPGTEPLPDGAARCIAHFASRAVSLAAARALRAQRPELEVPDPLPVEEEDWSRAWRVHHRPVRAGLRSWVHPPWQPVPLAPDEVAVAIDPGMAFGTGSHPTTALCLSHIDDLLRERPGADVLDVGTGSGVLALLAAKLGAGRVCGTENDPVALRAAEEAAQLNGLPPGRIGWQLRDPAALPPPWDSPYGIVVANILLNTLVELAPQIASKVARGGRLVLSGLLPGQAQDAASAYASRGLEPCGRAQREGWVLVELRAP